jgi:hypothetical protein
MRFRFWLWFRFRFRFRERVGLGLEEFPTVVVVRFGILGRWEKGMGDCRVVGKVGWVELGVDLDVVPSEESVQAAGKVKIGV